MSKNRSRRLLAAMGGVLILSGVGTTGIAWAATKFAATLSGENVPGGGDRDGWGRARIRVGDTSNSICVDLEVRSIGRVTSATLNRGGPGASGEQVVRLDRPGGHDQDSGDCDSIGDSLADDIQAHPGEFYVVITTDEFPNGALRGQLQPSAG
jgi:hypothetical protein